MQSDRKIETISNLFDLYEKKEISADYVNTVLVTRSEKLFSDCYRLNRIAKEYPQYKDLLIKPVLENHEIYNRLIKIDLDISCVLEAFPEYFEALLTCPYKLENCKSVFSEAYMFKSVARRLPRDEKTDKQIEVLVNVLINHEYKLIKTPSNISGLLDVFPDHKDRLIQPFIVNYNCLTLIAHEFPEHKNKCLVFLLNHPDKFKQVFQHEYNLQHAAIIIPDYKDTLSKGSPDAVLQAWQATQQKKDEVVLPHAAVESSKVVDSIEASSTDSFGDVVVQLGDVDIHHAPQIKTETTVATSTVTASPRLFVNTNGSKGKDLADKLLEDAIWRAAINAAREYREWYEGKFPHRGPNGSLSWWNHWRNGYKASENFTRGLRKCNNLEDLQRLINPVLVKSRFNNHSLGSFLLQELSKIEGSPWADLSKYPAYKSAPLKL